MMGGRATSGRQGTEKIHEFTFRVQVFISAEDTELFSGFLTWLMNSERRSQWPEFYNDKDSWEAM